MAGLFDEVTGGLVVYWRSKAAITALVGSGSAARIIPLISRKRYVGQTKIVFERGDGEAVNHLAGVSGMRHTVLYVYCYDSTLAGADAIAEAVRQNTANYRGTMSGTYVHWIECSDALDDGIDETLSATDTHHIYVRVILRITHAEALGV